MSARTSRTSRSSFSLLLGASVVFVFLAAGLGHILTVRAQVASSSDFVLRDGAIGLYGGVVSSTDYIGLSTGGILSGGRSTSTDFGSQDGPLDFDAFAPASQAWRWYSDIENETPAVPLANESVAPIDIAYNSAIKLRLTIKEIAGIGSSNAKFKLQYALSSDFSQAFDLIESNVCTPTSTWCYNASSTGPDGSVISSTVLSDPDTCSGGVGAGCGTHNLSGLSTSTFTHTASSAVEYEFTVKQAGALLNTTYFFRAYDLVNGAPVPTNGTSSYPSLSTEGATLSFSINGLPNGTTTGGIMTDASSTATAVSFGPLVINNQRAAAQRLTVSTNANVGYQIYTVEDQDLTNALAEYIPPVTATNGGPVSWNAACLSTSTGCYGYHTTASVLAGGSTRFAPDDTYARFETNLREVAYSSVPTTNESTDIIYKVQVRSDQGEGAYQHNVNYIVVPVF